MFQQPRILIGLKELQDLVRVEAVSWLEHNERAFTYELKDALGDGLKHDDMIKRASMHLRAELPKYLRDMFDLLEGVQVSLQMLETARFYLTREDTSLEKAVAVVGSHYHICNWAFWVHGLVDKTHQLMKLLGRRLIPVPMKRNWDALQKSLDQDLATIESDVESVRHWVAHGRPTPKGDRFKQRGAYEVHVVLGGVAAIKQTREQAVEPAYEAIKNNFELCNQMTWNVIDTLDNVFGILATEITSSTQAEASQ